LATVVNNRDVLNNRTASRNTEFQLGFDLLRDSSEFVLVKSDVGAVEGLENHVAGVRSWLARVAVQLQHVLIGVAQINLTAGLGVLASLLGLRSIRLGGSQVHELDALGSREERIGDFNLKHLRNITRHRVHIILLLLLLLLQLHFSLRKLRAMAFLQALLVGAFLCLLSNLVAGLLQLLILEVQ